VVSRTLSLLPFVAFLMGLSPCGGGGGGGDGDGDADGDGDVDSGPDPVEPFAVSVAGDARVAEISERFASFTVDIDRLTRRASGNLGIDWSDPRLRRLVQELSPAVMRIGGTVADTVYYDLDDSMALPPPLPYLEILDGSMWEATCAAARDLDLQIAFGLNAGDGPRDPEGHWTPDAARAFLERTRELECPVTVWELGNEVSSWFAQDLDNRPSPTELGADFFTARALLDEIDPDARLAGPASAFWPDYGEVGSPDTYLSDFLAECGPVVDVVTWHYYPTQSDGCPIQPRIPALEEKLLDPSVLDEVLAWADVVEGARDASAPGAQVWLGETANVLCGGQEGLSDRFAAGLWWLDQLGLLAKRGEEVVARQSLTGGNYHLIDAITLEPYPDYFNTILWRRLMGTGVLDARALSGPDASTGFDPANLRLYAHCTPGRPGAVTVLALNLDQAATAPLAFPSSGVTRELYLLTADDRLGTEVKLGGTVLEVPDEGPLPLVPVAATDPIELPPVSYAFVVLPEAGAPACE